ncbi:MAG TPA: nucleoside monophosphate kinase [Candidatus Saccharimonadales bacterium]
MIILTGVAGSGKSMQGKILADEHGYAWISTGEILRVLVTGKRRHEMLQGKLLSDEEMIHIMDKVLQLIDTKEEFVLDGFPRTVPQADWLLEQAKSGQFKLTGVVHLTASEDVVRQRLTERGRQDDNEEAIAKRFQEYNTVTLPIIEHFKKEGVRVYDIDAAQSPRAVHDQILRYTG